MTLYSKRQLSHSSISSSSFAANDHTGTIPNTYSSLQPQQQQQQMSAFGGEKPIKRQRVLWHSVSPLSPNVTANIGCHDDEPTESQQEDTSSFLPPLDHSSVTVTSLPSSSSSSDDEDTSLLHSSIHHTLPSIDNSSPSKSISSLTTTTKRKYFNVEQELDSNHLAALSVTDKSFPVDIRNFRDLDIGTRTSKTVGVKNHHCKFAQAGCPFTGTHEQVCIHETSYCTPLYVQLAECRNEIRHLRSRHTTISSTSLKNTTPTPYPFHSNSTNEHTTTITISIEERRNQNVKMEEMQTHIDHLRSDLRRARHDLTIEKNSRTTMLRKASERAILAMSLSPRSPSSTSTVLASSSSSSSTTSFPRFHAFQSSSPTFTTTRKEKENRKDVEKWDSEMDEVELWKIRYTTERERGEWMELELERMRRLYEPDMCNIGSTEPRERL